MASTNSTLKKKINHNFPRTAAIDSKISLEFGETERKAFSISSVRRHL